MQHQPKALPWYRRETKRQGSRVQISSGAPPTPDTTENPLLGPRTSSLAKPLTPSRHLSHLGKSDPCSLLPNQATPANRDLNELLKLLLERQQFPIHVSAVSAVRIVRILRTMLLL